MIYMLLCDWSVRYIALNLITVSAKMLIGFDSEIVASWAGLVHVFIKIKTQWKYLLLVRDKLGQILGIVDVSLSGGISLLGCSRYFLLICGNSLQFWRISWVCTNSICNNFSFWVLWVRGCYNKLLYGWWITINLVGYFGKAKLLSFCVIMVPKNADGTWWWQLHFLVCDEWGLRTTICCSSWVREYIIN
jgi:hypothetical protein